MTYRGLEFDPTPGRPDAVRAAITRLTSAESALGAVEPALRDAERRSATWRGAAADAFRARLRATPSDFDATRRRLRHAVAALEEWAGTLAAGRRHAEELDARAVRLRRELDGARDTVQDRQNALDLAATPSAAAGASIELSGATSRVADLEAALSSVLDEARDLAWRHRRVADEVADALAVGAAPAPRRPPSHALAGVLGTASGTAAALGGLLRAPHAGPVQVPAGAGAAFAGALAAGLRPSGEPIVLGENSPRGES